MTTILRNVFVGGIVLTAALMLAAPGPSASVSTEAEALDEGTEIVQELPAGVTQERINAGGELFQSEGCVTCHNVDATGKPGMTADLTDGTWGFTGGGDFEALAKAVKEGITADKTGGMPMPGASTRKLSDEQVAALAAYVWSLNQPTG